MKYKTRPMTDEQKRLCKEVTMTPDLFLHLAAPVVNLPGARENIEFYNKKSLEDIEKGLKKGSTFYRPCLHVDMDGCEVLSHEGRHRAFMAKKLGINQIPVMLCFKKNSPEMAKHYNFKTFHRYIDHFGLTIDDVNCEVIDLQPERIR